MGKSKGGKSSGYVSAGVNSNVKKSTLRAMRETTTVTEKWLNKKKAWAQGKNPWLTVENPDKGATNMKFIRVRANNHWGSPKDRGSYTMKGA